MCQGCAGFSRVWLFATPWTIACQSPLSVRILQARILEWVARPSPGDLPNPGIEPRSPTLQVDSLLSEPPGKLMNTGVGGLSGSSRLRNWTGVSCIAGEFFTGWTTREACAREYSPLIYIYHLQGLLEPGSCWGFAKLLNQLQWQSPMT